MAEASLNNEITDFSQWGYYDSLINMQEFKISISEDIENINLYEIISLITNVQGIYKYLVLENRLLTEQEFLEKMFENITYSVSSNYYFDKLEKELDESSIVKVIEKINNEINMVYVTEDEKPFLNNNGFNALGIVYPRKNDRVFVPVCKFDEKYFETLFVYKFERNDGTESFRTCSVKIDRINLNVFFFCNNPGYRNKKNESDFEQENKISSSDQFYYSVKNILSKNESIEFELHDTREEKKKMFEFCNLLNKEMVKDYENELTTKIKEICIKHIDEISSTISPLAKLDKVVKGKIYKKVFSTYLGESMMQSCDEEDLVFIAAERGLPGYPTLIDFVSSAASRGKTKTINKNSPLTFEEVFYSLNTDFGENQELEEWRISWFDSYYFDNAKTTDVSQSTIKIKKKYFKITNLNVIRKNKKMVEFIIGELRKNLY